MPHIVNTVRNFNVVSSNVCEVRKPHGVSMTLSVVATQRRLKAAHTCVTHFIQDMSLIKSALRTTTMGAMLHVKQSVCRNRAHANQHEHLIKTLSSDIALWIPTGLRDIARDIARKRSMPHYQRSPTLTRRPAVCVKRFRPRMCCLVAPPDRIHPMLVNVPTTDNNMKTVMHVLTAPQSHQHRQPHLWKSCGWRLLAARTESSDVALAL